MTLRKSVSFSEATSTYRYSRPTADEIVKLYYQEDDYRRFREEKWLEELRAAKTHYLDGKVLSKSRRRDSLNMRTPMQSPGRKQQGIAQAA